MKGLVVNENHHLILVNDIPMPIVGEYQALVKIDCCSFCNGTDREIIEGRLPEAGNYPLTIGHEAVGHIVDTGQYVRYYKCNQLVLRPCLPPSEKYGSAWGGFSEYGLVTDVRAMKENGVLKSDHQGMTQQIVPDEIAPEDASIIITMKETYAAVERMNILRNSVCMILGSGPVALCMAQALKLKGVGRIVIIGRNPVTLNYARRMGIEALNIKVADEIEDIKCLQKRVDHYIDTVGTSQTISDARKWLCEDGMIDVYGLGHGDVIFPDDCVRNWGVRFIRWPTLRSEANVHDTVVRAILEGRIDVHSLITHTFPLEAYESAYAKIKEKTALKVVLKFGDRVV